MTRQAADTLYVLTDEGAAVGISIRQLDVIEISTSVDRAAGVRRGALLGTAAGTAGGLIIWLAGFEDDNGEKATSGDAALFAGAGLVAGIIYGASQGKRVGQTISLQPRASLWPRPGGRVAVAVRLPL